MLFTSSNDSSPILVLKNVLAADSPPVLYKIYSRTLKTPVTYRLYGEQNSV